MPEEIVSTAPAAPAENTETQVDIVQNPTEQAVVDPEKSETEVTDETPSDPVKDAEAEAKRGRNRESRRIDKLHRERAEANARADIFQRQYSELQASMRPKESEGAPKLEDFQDIDSYAEAFAKHRFSEYQKAGEQNQRQVSEQQHVAQLKQGWDKKVDAADAKYDDFHAKLGDYIPDPNKPWSRAIMSAENGADIAYHLQSNIKEAERISRLNGFDQVFEIGKLAAKLASQSPAARKISQAPTPIRPLSGGATNSDKKFSDMSYDERAESRRKYIANKR